jgi:phosphate transport system permease protein
MWGLFVLVPFVQMNIQLPAMDTVARLPLIGFLFESRSFAGTNLFTASLVLAIMILPFIAATMRDVFEQVPAVFKESAYGLGATRWEVVRRVVLPYTRISVVGGIMLGLGRALGETMAVTFIIGNANRMATSLFDPTTTIASIVAMEFPESLTGSLKQSALLGLGFLLFVISFIVLAASRFLLRSRLKA